MTSTYLFFHSDPVHDNLFSAFLVTLTFSKNGGLNLHWSRGHVYAIVWQYKLVRLLNYKQHSRLGKWYI